MSARLFDPMRKDKSFPFEYRNSANTDVRETIQRARERMAKTPTVVRQIQQQRKASK